MEIEYSKLNWPKGLNLDLLLEILTEDQLKEFLAEHAKKKRLERRIVLPSATCIKKVYFHNLWSLIEKGETTWEEIKNDFKKEFKSLRSISVSVINGESIGKCFQS